MGFVHGEESIYQPYSLVRQLRIERPSIFKNASSAIHVKNAPNMRKRAIKDMYA